MNFLEERPNLVSELLYSRGWTGRLLESWSGIFFSLFLRMLFQHSAKNFEW